MKSSNLDDQLLRRNGDQKTKEKIKAQKRSHSGLITPLVKFHDRKPLKKPCTSKLSAETETMRVREMTAGKVAGEKHRQKRNQYRDGPYSL